MKLRILVIGSGGREHALAWKLKQSASVECVFHAPGSPGTISFAKQVPLKVDDLQGLLKFAQEEKVDLTVVGPEFPLSLGIVDVFKTAGLRIFGPSQACARLESSKAFAKEIMDRAGVPTAKYRTFQSESEAVAYVKQEGTPIVIKVDGLAAGKGVFVCMNEAEALEGIRKSFQELRSDSVVVEEFLEGREVSFIVATDGERIVPMAATHDYKRVGDGDSGPNTGGMGAVCPTPRFNPNLEKDVIAQVIVPVLKELKRAGTPYQGFLYAGLMISPKDEIRVLEFNARFGDPECQPIMRRLKSDLAEILIKLVEGGDEPIVPIWHDGATIGIVLASKGYPDSPEIGDEITGINLAENISNVVVFHAGTSKDGEKLKTSGGRVLTVTAQGEDVEAARRTAYRAVDMIQFRGLHVRRDIGLL